MKKNQHICMTGFTLIEVLIALSLLSVMMLMLFAGLRMSAKSWDKGESKITQVSEMTSVHNFFHNQLAASLPLWDDFTKKDSQFSFKGAEHRLQFVTSLPASSRRLGLQHFDIYLKNNKIKVAVKPFYPTLTGEQWKIEDVTLIDQITALTFSYFGSEKTEGIAEWQNKWVYGHLPQLVSIDIETVKKNYWPQIVLRLTNKIAPQRTLNIFEKALEKSNQNGNTKTKSSPFSKRGGIDSCLMGVDIIDHYGRKLCA